MSHRVQGKGCRGAATAALRIGYAVSALDTELAKVDRYRVALLEAIEARAAIVEADVRAEAGAAQPAEVTCAAPGCTNRFPPVVRGRRAKLYCSDRCRQKASARRRRDPMQALRSRINGEAEPRL